jgi:peptidoglycan/xylan/chitin deacetylase (PgdA/CDA1 family)
MYHRIGRPARQSPVNGQYVTPETFARHMGMLSRAGMQVAPLGEIALHIRGQVCLPDRCLAITFDDGFANLYTNAFPVLCQYSYPATVFLVSSFIGQMNTYHPPDQDLYEPMLSELQIREMMDRGVEFGSHTRRHARLTECSPEDLLDQVAGSRQDLQRLLCRDVSSFCYPYGAQNDVIRQVVMEAGYDLACSTLKGRNHAGADPYRIRRINVRADTSLPIFYYKLVRARLFDR